MSVNNTNVRKYIRSDIYRYYGDDSKKNMILIILKDSLVRWHIAFRLGQCTGMLRVLGKVLLKINRYKKSIILPTQTKVGFGLYIGHGGPIVVNQTAIIGNNVNLSQFTTIGSNHKKAAIIGDYTYIGPNVCIVEDVVIGSKVTIGAGSVVTKDIPDNATACGNYARVINYDNPGRYTNNNRWTDFSE